MTTKFSSAEFKIGPGGILIAPSYHDGELSTITVSRSRITLVITLAARDSLQISMMSPSYFTADSVWEGNIVDSIFLWDHDTAPFREIETFASRRSATTDFLLAEMAKRERRLFSLHCSIGAELFCLFERIEFARLQD